MCGDGRTVNDMRLIDADALLKSAGIFEAKACARGCGKSVLRLAKAWLWNEVNKAPIIDAVPVVRCKDCKHLNSACCGLGTNDFCSYGERKDGDG